MDVRAAVAFEADKPLSIETVQPDGPREGEVLVEVKATGDAVRLGEPLTLKWKVTNQSDQPVPVPTVVDAESLTARVSVTDAQGNVTFMRPLRRLLRWDVQPR